MFIVLSEGFVVTEIVCKIEQGHVFVMLAAQFIKALFDRFKLHNTIIKVSLAPKQQVPKCWRNENLLRAWDGLCYKRLFY